NTKGGWLWHEKSSFKVSACGKRVGRRNGVIISSSASCSAIFLKNKNLQNSLPKVRAYVTIPKA
ncbi:hypothetical protein ACYKOW_10580, partial [Streptococcus suis]